ncbi:hypothetical protein VNI00_016215 [Paramarasmius palmivorus]|uniref:Uncharacterized protein n=1 Tax=Paramarasmius palmivorus TaxID=297713 RepID=A0AAW0BD08_9AGAR
MFDEEHLEMDVPPNVGSTNVHHEEFFREALLEFQPILYPTVKELKGKKTVLYFPTHGLPSLTQIDRQALLSDDYLPYLDVSCQPPEGAGVIRRTYMITDPAEHYVVVYFHQTRDNCFPRNEFLTSSLESLAEGKRRPWLGPLVAYFVSDDVLDSNTVDAEIEQVVEHLHSIYERLHPDASVLFDALPVDASIKYCSVDDLFESFTSDLCGKGVQ